MADAYAFADGGGRQPHELELHGYLQHFGGALNVMGRPLGLGEMRRMMVAVNINDWYHQREAHRDAEGNINFGEWCDQNPTQADALDAAYKLAKDMGLVESKPEMSLEDIQANVLKMIGGGV